MSTLDVSAYKTGTVTAFPRPGILSIANQLKFGFVSVLVVALLVMAGSLIYLSVQTQQGQLRTIQEERAKDGAAQITAYMDDLQRKLGYLARVRGLTEMPLEVQANLLEGLARHNTAYEALTILDSSGQTVQQVSSYGHPVELSLNDSLAFSRAFNLKEDFVGAVEVDRATNLPYVTLAVPIRDQDDQVDGVLSAIVNLKFLWFVTSQVRVGKSGYAYVVDNRGFLIAKQGSLPESFQLEEISAGFIGQNFESNNIEQGDTYQGLEGVEVVGASAPVRTSRWTVVVELPTAEAYAPTRTMLLVMGIVVTIATVVAVGLAILLSHSISSRLIKLRNAALMLGKGELGSRVEIKSKDEIGDLAMSFNHMADELQNTLVSKDYVDNVIGSMIAALIVINPDGTIRTVNRATQELSGYEEDELIGKPVTLVLTEKLEASFVGAQLKEVLARGFLRDLSLTVLTKSGERIPVTFSGSAMRDATGKLTAIVGVARDTREINRLIEQEKQLAAAAAKADAQTEKALELEDALKNLRATHQELQTTQAQLVQSGKMAGLGQIGAGIAHELNQPITSIQGFAQRLRRRDRSAHMSEELDIIINGTHRMARIVDNIRTFARQGDFQAAPTDPVEPLDDALMLLSEQLRLHGVEVEKTTEEALPHILGDKIRLQQVFFNLLGNALDALNEVQEGRPKRLRLGLERDGNQILYTVEDSGPGIPDANKTQIFDPFFTTKPVGKGIGLGLSLSYGIVADHGGELAYRRSASGGALFTVRIPLAPMGAKGGSKKHVVSG